MKLSSFGKTASGEEVSLFTLSNNNGMRVELINYGAAIRSITIPGPGGETDIVLGFDDIAGYEADTSYQGATIGRVSNRIENSRFVLNGKTYDVDKNENENHLHGGLAGFNSKIWSAEPYMAESLKCGVKFSLYSPDGECGYPGGLNVSVIYTLGDDNALSIEYFANAEQDTLCSLTNHAYFNLAGGGDISGHMLKLNSNFYLKSKASCIPTGEVLSVADTGFDFSSQARIGNRLNIHDNMVQEFGGIDHCYTVNGCGIREAAWLFEPKSGRSLYVYTDFPGLQVYTANDLDIMGKNNVHYKKHDAICLEAQGLPNCINIGHFPTCILRAGEEIKNTIVYKCDF